MEQQAKIFLSDERGLVQSDWLRTYSTFNFGAYQTAYKTPVASLYVLNDDTLAGEKSTSMKVEEDTFIIILPVAGAVEYKDDHTNTIAIAGQVITAGLDKNSVFTLANPYPEALINFLQLWIKIPGIRHSTHLREHSFNINANKNIFIQKALAAGITLHIGKFDGRQKATLDLNSSNTVFAFVIQGAFELEERLLHARDGLALWNQSSAEMEALSNDAIMLFIEMS
jgi:quercetin 2,3-dioxygenase